jgi:protein-L-isoaspartate(D-aspartate) O-methyltransferase
MAVAESYRMGMDTIPDDLVTDEKLVSQRIQMLMRLRNLGITDRDVLNAMEQVPRELFIDDHFRDHAYEDVTMPILCGQSISQPSVVAWMTWALDIGPRMRVLEIGTGSGYQACVLAKLCRRVYTVERHRDLLATAEARFHQQKITNIVTRRGDGTKGWKEVAPFERIIVTAAAPEVPASLLAQLSPGGVMVLPVGAPDSQQILLRIQKGENGQYHSQHLMNVRFVPLVSET